MQEKSKPSIKSHPGSTMRSVSDGVDSDPFGMYTGVSLDGTETPVQDADDL